MRSTSRLVASIVLALLAPRALGAGEWARFRGPAGAGVAEDGVAYPGALDPERNLLWNAEIDAGASSPCVHGERIFVTGTRERELSTSCIDRATGELVWRRAIAVEALERTNETHGPASPTPVSDGERVLIYFGSFGLVCYDAQGEELWRRELPVPENTFGTAASPVIEAGRVYFVSDANDASYLESIDLATGETLWRRERTGFQSGWSTPATWTNGETAELLVYGVFQLTAYSLEDGERRWSVPGLADEPIITPATGEGLVFVTSYNMRTNPEVIGLPNFEAVLAEHDDDGSGSLNAAEAAENQSVLSRPDADGEGDHPLKMFFRHLDADRDGEITSEEWQKLVAWVETFQHANGIVAIRPGGDERAPEIAWQFPRGVPECPSPLYYRGRVWLVMNGGTVTCLDARTGELRFQDRLGARGPYYASPVAADGRIYAASARGELSVFAAADRLELLASTALGERLLATPALSDGVVYVRTESRLRAFGATR